MFICFVLFNVCMCFVSVTQQAAGGPTVDHATVPNDNGHDGSAAAKPRNSDNANKNRSNRPPPGRRTDPKPKEALVNGTTA